jgi:hypothetical protein
VEILTMTILGGTNGLTGPVLGSLILSLLPELLRAFKDFRLVVNGVILMVIVLFLPKGIWDPARFARMHIPPYTHQQFRADLDRVTQRRIDHDLAEAFVGNSNAAVHWMRKIGVQWEHEKPVVDIDGKLYFEPGINIHPIGGGLGMLKSLREIALKKEFWAPETPRCACEDAWL